MTPAVRWREPRNGEWLPLVPAPGENRGFAETRVYLFEKPGDSWQLLVDDEPLDVEPAQPSCWRWQPGFFAGEVTAELRGNDGEGRCLFLLDVAPDDRKVGRELFQQMVDELWDADPAFVIGEEPAQRQIGDLGAAQDPWLEFARFRRYVPEFLRAIEGVRARPRRTLAVARTSAALHQVRRADRRTAVSIVRSGGAALLADPLEDLPAADGDIRLDVPHALETLDSAPNRALLALLRALVRRGLRLRERLQALVERDPRSDTRTQLASRWPARRQVLDDLLQALRRLVRVLPFSHVSRAEITAAGLTGVAADPSYARAWGRGWRALRHGLESDRTAERLWISPSWEIYERWCLLRLGRALAAAMPAWNWRAHSRGRRWTAAFDGTTAELLLQPVFPAYDSGGSRRSISGERQPDIVLTVTGPDGPRFVVLDAKYRTSRQGVLDAMASAHLYRDALRVGDARPLASLLLVPAGGGAPWLEDPAFQSAQGVGACVLSPGQPSSLPAAVRAAFE